MAPDVRSTDDLLHSALGIIANAFGGDWNKAPEQWRKAAERWRDQYHDYLDHSSPEIPDS